MQAPFHRPKSMIPLSCLSESSAPNATDKFTHKLSDTALLHYGLCIPTGQQNGLCITPLGTAGYFHLGSHAHGQKNETPNNSRITRTTGIMFF